MLNTIISILKYVAFYVIMRIFVKVTMVYFLTKKHAKEKHMCNHCQFGFTTTLTELQFEYCPYCGRPLDYHEYDERSESYKGDNENDIQSC